MQPITSIKIVTKSGHPAIIRLGDIFTMRSEFVPVASDVDVSDYIILGLLTTAIAPSHAGKPGRIYFSMIGMDRFKYSISKRTENGLIILSRGKEIELNESYILKVIKIFSNYSNKHSAVVEGLELYMRTIVTNRINIRKMDVHKLKMRLMDLSKWPKTSLVVWAIRHLGIASRGVPQSRYIDNKIDMIHSMIKSSISTNRLIEVESSKHVLARVRGTTGGRLPDKSILVHSRHGSIQGVPFINLRSIEIRSSLDNCIRVYPAEDVQPSNLGRYMIVCVEGRPNWASVQIHDDPQLEMIWRFCNRLTRSTMMRVFTNDTLEWLLDKLYGAYSWTDVRIPTEISAGLKVLDENKYTQRYNSTDSIQWHGLEEEV